MKACIGRILENDFPHYLAIVTFFTGREPTANKGGARLRLSNGEENGREEEKSIEQRERKSEKVQRSRQRESELVEAENEEEGEKCV